MKAEISLSFYQIVEDMLASGKYYLFLICLLKNGPTVLKLEVDV